MQLYKKKWWVWFLVHLSVPIVFYLIAFFFNKTSFVTIIGVIFATCINYLITMHCSYHNKGTKWLLWILLINIISIPSTIIHIFFNVIMVKNFLITDALGLLFPFSLPFIYYSYKIRSDYISLKSKRTATI